MQYSKHNFWGNKSVFQNPPGVGISEIKFSFRYIGFLQTTNIANLPQILQIHQTNTKFAILRTQLLRKRFSFAESLWSGDSRNIIFIQIYFVSTYCKCCIFTANTANTTNYQQICNTLNTTFKETNYFSRIPLEWGFLEYIFYLDISDFYILQIMQIYCKNTTNVTIRLNKRHICNTLNTIFKEKKIFFQNPLRVGISEILFLFRYISFFILQILQIYCKYTTNVTNRLNKRQICNTLNKTLKEIFFFQNTLGVWISKI